MKPILSFTDHLTGVEIRLCIFEQTIFVSRHWTCERSGKPRFKTLRRQHVNGEDNADALALFQKSITREITNASEFAP